MTIFPKREFSCNGFSAINSGHSVGEGSRSKFIIIQCTRQTCNKVSDLPLCCLFIYRNESTSSVINCYFNHETKLSSLNDE